MCSEHVYPVAGIVEGGGGRNLSCGLLEFQEGVSHFLWVNLADVYCCWSDDWVAPTQVSAKLCNSQVLLFLTELCYLLVTPYLAFCQIL